MINKNRRLAEKIDRDLYALAITLYESATGHYPFIASIPPIGQSPPHPKDLELKSPISDPLANFLCRGVAPLRSDRFATTTEFLQALKSATETEEITNSYDLSIPIEKIRVAEPDNIYLPQSFEVILDPTEMYSPLDNMRIISTELEWLKYFFREDKPYWIKGNRLCNLTRTFLTFHDKQSAIVAEKTELNQNLQQVLGNMLIPTNWSEEYISTLNDRLSTLSPNISLAELLAKVPISQVLNRSIPPVLAPTATVTEALTWATEQYLPFRVIEVNSASLSQSQSDRLGERFAKWLYDRYPELISRPVDDSPLNYNSTYTVTQLISSTSSFMGSS